MGRKKRYMDKIELIMRNNKSKYPNQVVGNLGLFYVCYQLSRMGWNAMPTSRNAKGIDILIYSQDAKNKKAIQVKSLSRKNPIPLGNTNELFCDFLVICREVFKEPEIFVMEPIEIKDKIHKGVNKDGKNSYWLQPKDYEEFKNKWEKIGNGNN